MNEKAYGSVDSGKDSADETRQGKVAVTGGTGLVGSHLVAELYKSGYRKIVLLVRDKCSLEKLYATLREEQLDTVKVWLDVRETAFNDPHSLKEALLGVKTVFHCAGVVDLGTQNEERIVRVNVEMTQHVVDACLRAGVERLVHVSSVAVFESGCCESSRQMTDRIKPLSAMKPYAKSKFLSENEVRRGAESGLKTVIVNPAVILGKGGGTNGSSAIISALKKGLPFYTKGATSFVDVKDVAAAMVTLVSEPEASGKQYILSSGTHSFRDLVAMTNSLLCKPKPVVEIGKRVPAILKMLGILKYPSGVDRFLFQESYYDGSQITQDFGFRYTPLEATLKRLIK